MHRKRVVVALIGLPLLLWVVLAGPAWLLAIVVGAAAVGIQFEFYRLQGARLPRRERGLGLGAGLLVAASAATGDPAVVLAVVVAGTLALFVAALARPAEASGAAGRVGLLAFGLLYGPLLLGHLTLARWLPGETGPAAVVLALAAAWGGDTAAYYVGKAAGRRKLYPAVSPGKTWEGAVGGALGTLLAMALVRGLLAPGLALGHVAALGLLAAAAGQVGDLCESLLKRGAGVKDSGGLLPGHGGLLDRLDALLFVAPLVYYYLRTLEG